MTPDGLRIRDAADAERAVALWQSLGLEIPATL
jgi:hypothetical protein